jgi:hypothetical protein
MNGEPAQVPPGRKGHRLQTVVLILVGLIALYAIYHLSLSHSIQGRIDSIHRAGFPVTWVELDKWYAQPPAGENAADVYREAFAHYEAWTNKPAQLSTPSDADDKSKFSSRPRSKRDLLPVVGTAKLPPRTEPLPAEMQQHVAEYLSDNAEALRLLHQAAAMKSCRYPADLSLGIASLLPHLNLIRQAARLLSLEAIQDTEQQRPQAAVESVVASLGVARSLNQEPILITQLVRIACQGISLDSLERILSRMPLTDEQLTKLAAALEESGKRQAMTRAFVGERCCWAGFFEGARRGKVPLEEIGSPESQWLSVRPVSALYRASGLLELDEKSCLDFMERYVKATELPPPENLAAASVVADETNQVPRWCVISRMLLPALDRALGKVVRCDAKIRDALTAIAVERYRLANGKLPDRLSDLAPTFLPAVPTDPFDGKPLRYKPLAKGYVVYSVGDDRQDNGGIEKDAKGVSYVPGTDITFTIER